MKKSLYKKFYIVIFTIIPAIFLLLGSIVVAFSGNYWLTQNQRLLASQADTVARQIASAHVFYQGQQLNHYAYQISSVISRSTECQVLVVNENGQPVIGVGDEVRQRAVDRKYYAPYLEEAQVFTGDLGGGLRRPCAVAACPIEIDGQPCGVVYSVMPLEQIAVYVKDLVNILLVAIGVTLVVMAFVVYFMVSALVKPLTQMSNAAKRLAEGDFTAHIAVKRQDEIGRLAAAFNDMTRSLEAGEKMRKGFVANVSHELKTPMTTIAGFVDGMLDGTVPREKHSEYLAIVSEEVKRLSRLVGTMLNLAKLESGETLLHPTDTNLSELVFRSVLLQEGALTEKNIQCNGLTDLPELFVSADQDLMYQVVQNLVDNSVKYTPDGGWIFVRGWVQDQTVHFCIRNSGQGIAEQDLPFVFDRFYKVDASRGTNKNSLGLGLYLVKTIVNLHGGSITVRSVEHSFCEFELVMEQSPHGDA